MRGARTLEAYVALQSRGLPIALPDDPRLDAWRALGCGMAVESPAVRP